MRKRSWKRILPPLLLACCVLPLSADSLYWSAGLDWAASPGPDASLGAIGVANLDGSDQRVVYSSATRFAPYEIAIDSVTNQIFSTDVSFHQIEHLNLNGAGEQVISVGASQLPQGIAIDSGAGKIYWADGTAGHIFRANLDGSGQETILSGLNPLSNIPGNMGGPNNLTLDTVNGKIYWISSFDHTIMRANLDGTGQQVILSGLNEPSGLALDANSGKIYWTDWDATIHVANLDGSGAKTLMNAPSVLSYANTWLALDITAVKLFWGKTYLNAGVYEEIWSANLDGSNPQEVVGGFSFLNDIAVGPDPVPASTLPASVPEPATLGLAALGGLALACRKRITNQ